PGPESSGGVEMANGLFQAPVLHGDEDQVAAVIPVISFPPGTHPLVNPIAGPGQSDPSAMSRLGVAAF
ncbi:MAG: hypothetical protein OEO23_04145, partial [Gemmatimonadota bacterium]|nr:hypothetical protein [Gemmatimonadota bacterium]